MNLQDKIAVITGSTRGFGNALARALLARGATVVISGRRQDAVDAAVARLQSQGEAFGMACDVSIAEEVHALATKTLQRFGRIDVWVNNAGITALPGRTLDFPPEIAAQVWRVNALGTFLGTQTAVAVMKRQPAGGVIVNIYGRGSNGRPASPNGLYGASKAWITSFTRTVAQEYRDLPIRFVGFSPGMMTTDMLRVQEVVGQHILAQLRHLPMVLEALATPPEAPAAALVHLLEHNSKPFVEYRTLHSFRLLKGLARMAWMRLRGAPTLSPEALTIHPPYEPPLAGSEPPPSRE